jgi:uncharacterized protein (TIGR00725 family)
MNATLLLDRVTWRLRLDDGRAFDAATRTWTSDPTAPSALAERIDAVAAVRWLADDANLRWRVPVGVVGPREVSAARYALAEQIGAGLARMRVPVLCGGRSGVMEAVCKGAASSGGVAIGLLPDAEPTPANAHATLVLATGIGEARNALVARASVCLVAIGDSFGTLSEVALARQFGKRVIGLAGAANVEGVEHVADVPEALQRVAQALLDL